MTKPIPVRKLRQFKRQLDAMGEAFDEHYPGLRQRVGLWSNSITETVRNIDTAAAEIEGWILKRTQGKRSDGDLPPTSD